jgi:hypothetical protein
MYYWLLIGVLTKRENFHIFIDIKDSCGSDKRQKLRRYLCSRLGDFDMRLIKDIQATKSDQVELVQLADLLIGSLMHANSRRKSSPARDALVLLTQQLSRYTLKTSTTLGESKFNLFHWCPDWGKQ